MEKYSIFDLFDKNTGEDDFVEILDDISSNMDYYLLNKDISSLDNCTQNPILDELSKSRGRLSKLLPENIFQDLEKRKIYAIAYLFASSFIYKTINKEIDFKEKNLEPLKYKYTKDFIYFLSKNPVVTKVQLCEHLKISKSTLNRFLTKIDQFDLYEVRRYSKGNRYFGTREAFHLFKIINKMEKISTMFQKFK